MSLRTGFGGCGGPNSNKYSAVREVVDGHTFPSRREARRYRQLKLMTQAGEIEDLELQPKFPLEINGRPVLIKSDGYPNGRRASYIADFRYRLTETGCTVVEDVKGMDTPVSRLKRAFVEAQFGIQIVVL